jgi:adenylylsulfate kinase
VHIRAGEVSVAEAVNQLLAYLHERGALQAGYKPVALEA